MLILLTKIVILLHLIHVPGELALTSSQQDSVVFEAEKKLEKAFPQIDIQVNQKTDMLYDELPFEWYPMLNSRIKYIPYVIDYYNWENNGSIKVFIDHPELSSLHYMYGWACVACYQKSKWLGGYAQAAVKWEGPNGEPRFKHSVLVVMHEILHTLGALHVDNGLNVMHPSGIGLVDQYPNKIFRLRPRTKKQVGNFLKSLEKS